MTDSERASRKKYLNTPRGRQIDRAKARRARDRVKAAVSAMKAADGCACGERDPAALDYHHRDPATKDKDITRLINHRYTITAIRREIAKCICICANCHRKGHAGRPRHFHADCFPATLKPEVQYYPTPEGIPYPVASGCSGAVASCAVPTLANVVTADLEQNDSRAILKAEVRRLDEICSP